MRIRSIMPVPMMRRLAGCWGKEAGLKYKQGPYSVFGLVHRPSDCCIARGVAGTCSLSTDGPQEPAQGFPLCFPSSPAVQLVESGGKLVSLHTFLWAATLAPLGSLQNILWAQLACGSDLPSPIVFLAFTACGPVIGCSTRAGAQHRS